MMFSIAESGIIGMPKRYLGRRRRKEIQFWIVRGDRLIIAANSSTV